MCIRSVSTKGCAKRGRGRNDPERERENRIILKNILEIDVLEKGKKLSMQPRWPTHTQVWDNLMRIWICARVRTAQATVLLTSNFVWLRWTDLNSLREIGSDPTNDLRSSSSSSSSVSFPSSVRTINEYWSEPSLLVEEISFVYLYTLD